MPLVWRRNLLRQQLQFDRLFLHTPTWLSVQLNSLYPAHVSDSFGSLELASDTNWYSSLLLQWRFMIPKVTNTVCVDRYMYMYYHDMYWRVGHASCHEKLPSFPYGTPAFSHRNRILYSTHMTCTEAWIVSTPPNSLSPKYVHLWKKGTLSWVHFSLLELLKTWVSLFPTLVVKWLVESEVATKNGVVICLAYLQQLFPDYAIPALTSAACLQILLLV